MERTTVIILLEVERGAVNQARDIIGRSLRAALGIRKWHTEPYGVSYVPASEVSHKGGMPYYSVEMTEEESVRWWETFETMADDEGWSDPPGRPYYG